MTLRNGHGRGAGQPRIEVMPADELPVGVPDPSAPVEIRRNKRGQPADAQSQRALAALGGKASGERKRLERLLGRVELPDDHPLAPYRRDAADWRNAHLERLAATVGGGEVGPAVQAVVSTAALQHAASRWLFDRSVLEQSAALALQASRLGDAARQNILAAHELAAREAQAREPRGGGHAPNVQRQLVEAFGAPATPPAAAPATPKTTGNPSESADARLEDR